jgi:hypothetical protein
VEKSVQAEIVAGAGRGALVTALAGAGWLGWGLGVAQAYNAVVGSIFGAVALFLWIWSVYAIRTGRALRRLFPAPSVAASRFPTRPFTLVVLIEAFAIIVVVIAADRFHRTDLATLGCALVIGVHYLPLAKIFHAPILAVLGVLITLWCVLSGALFRLNPLLIAVSIGMGILLWAASIATLLRARSIARSLRS